MTHLKVVNICLVGILVYGFLMLAFITADVVSTINVLKTLE